MDDAVKRAKAYIEAGSRRDHDTTGKGKDAGKFLNFGKIYQLFGKKVAF